MAAIPSPSPQRTLMLLTFGLVLLVVGALRSIDRENYISLARWPVTDTVSTLAAHRLPPPSSSSSQQRRKSLLARLFRRRPRAASVELAAMGEAVLEDSSSSSSLYTTTSLKGQLMARLGHKLRGKQTLVEELTSVSKDVDFSSLTRPIMAESAWDALTGDEWIDHGDEWLNDLAIMAEQLARQDSNDLDIDWHPYAVKGDLQDGDVHVWTGKAVGDGVGSKVPWIKTRSIIPLTPEEMVDLLLDSTRVQTYNQWSTGRTDVWVDPNSALTKIVKNRTQPPIGSKAMVSVTLLHARPVSDDGSWLVVSRAIGGQRFLTEEDRSAGRSDILLGVNLLQPHNDDSSLVTAITHVYSSVVPSMLAESLGVKGAVKFVKDVRRIAVPAS